MEDKLNQANQVGDDKLSDFLTKVDEIESIIKTFNTNDEEKVDEAMKKADHMIGKLETSTEKTSQRKETALDRNIGFDKTVINTAAFKDDAPSPAPNPKSYQDKDSFMAAMEVDAKQRAERRKVRESEANEIRLLGNAEFVQGNYEAALAFYSQALEKVRDNMALYTNRAQTFIKLGKYEEALVDCDWALRVSPQCVKAYIHQGRAELGLKHYGKAREAFTQLLQVDATKQQIVKDYIAEVDRLELAETEENTAQEMFAAGDASVKTIVEILQKVNRPDQLPAYYSGGFRLVTNLLTNADERTTFRVHGGLGLCTDHTALSRCLRSSPKSLSGEQHDLISAAMDMFTAAISNLEHSQEVLLQQSDLISLLLGFLEAKLSGQGRHLQRCILGLLHTLSQYDVGRSKLVMSVDLHRLLQCMFRFSQKPGSESLKAVAILNNLALDKRFKVAVRDKLDSSVLPSFELLLKKCKNVAALPCCISMMTNLTGDTKIRREIINREQIWQNCLSLLKEHTSLLDTQTSEDIVYSVLGLLMNLTVSGNSDKLDHYNLPITKTCCGPSKQRKCCRVHERSVGMLSHLLPHCETSVQWVCENGVVPVLLNNLKDNTSSCDLTKSSLKSLTACTQHSEMARQYIVDNSGLGALIKFLQSEDEILIGNAALSLSHCSAEPKVCKALAKTNIIQDLLVLARDGQRIGVQQNCAILIAKLVQGDAKNLERLRELHGIEILHSCMKYIK